MSQEAPFAAAVSLTEYLEHERRRLMAFEGWWRNGMLEEPNRFPPELPRGEWDEQLMTFDDEVEP